MCRRTFATPRGGCPPKFKWITLCRLSLTRLRTRGRLLSMWRRRRIKRKLVSDEAQEIAEAGEQLGRKWRGLDCILRAVVEMARVRIHLAPSRVGKVVV